MEFDTKISTLEANVGIYGNAIKEVGESPKLKKVFDIILNIGNFLNHGTAKGNCSGFNLGTLKKLGDTKATINSKISIIHYIVEFVQKCIFYFLFFIFYFLFFIFYFLFLFFTFFFIFFCF